jgi:signal transduction histidine kinase
VILWLGTGLTLSLLSGHWDAGSQMILLISFGSACGCTATISELAVAHAQLREYSAQVEELSIVRERNRIAREIHDTLGHSLTLLAVQLETAMQHEMRGDPRLHEELVEARQVAKNCLTDVRYSVEALRPAEVSSGSLQEQLRRLAATGAPISQELQISLDLEEAPLLFPPEVHLTLYRCAQEALTNIRKHAHATRVLLRLSADDEQVELTVLNNDQRATTEQEQHAPGFGLQGMRERVTSLGGSLRAGPEPRQGWRVEVLIPLMPQRQVKRDSIRRRNMKEKV